MLKTNSLRSLSSLFWPNLLKFIALIILFRGATVKSQTTIYTAKRIYTMDSGLRVCESMVAEKGRILFTGSLDTARRLYPEANLVQFKNRFIYPGFIDAHCHFLAWCRGLKECNLIGTKSEQEVISRLKKYASTTTRSWIVGRGWDQNDWPQKNFPGIENLDKAFPDKPVCLKRIDGHAVWINSAAVKALNLDLNKNIPGGEIVKINGKFSGILVDNAADLVLPFVPDLPRQEMNEAVRMGAQQCYAVGLTTLDEAGLDLKDIYYIDSLQQNKMLKMRIYAMLAASEKSFSWIGANNTMRTERLHVGGVKFYLDGALGSRGALLKKDYCDRLGHKGLLLQNVQQFTNYCSFAGSKGYQICVHAIGDSANSIALNVFGKIQPAGFDNRWRIEHAQVVDPKEFSLFKKFKVIPSVQPTHATSDGAWAENRLCSSRMTGAYNYAELGRQAGLLALGTDFPVEDISPIKTFYSAVFRVDMKSDKTNPFMPDGGLKPVQALLGMTIWAAYANKEEHEKGSLENGKLADFVVLNTDLLEAEQKQVAKTRVTATYINGEKVFGK
jgi:predicted amidohydrolase YtcJ